MEHKIYNLQAGLLVGFTCLLAVALCVNAVQALAGKANFAYWHCVTLIACIRLTKASVSPAIIEQWELKLETLLRKAVNLLSQAFTSISRAVRSLAALFKKLLYERMFQDWRDRGPRPQLGKQNVGG